MIDPISLQQVAADVASRMGKKDRSAMAFSNAIMSQIVDAASRNEAEQKRTESPEVTGAESNEDLFVFTVEHVTLKKVVDSAGRVERFRRKYARFKKTQAQEKS